MDPNECPDVGARIARQVEKAHRIARWLRVCQVVYAALSILGFVMLAQSLGPTLRMNYALNGWAGVLSVGSSYVEMLVYLVFLLVLAETARRIVLVVAHLADEVKETV